MLYHPTLLRLRAALRQSIRAQVDHTLPQPVCIRPLNGIRARIVSPQRPERDAKDAEDQAVRQLERKAAAQALFDNLARAPLPLVLLLQHAWRGQRQRQQIVRQPAVPVGEVVDELRPHHEVNCVDLTAQVLGSVPPVFVAVFVVVVARVNEAEYQPHDLALGDVVGQQPARLVSIGHQAAVLVLDLKCAAHDGDGGKERAGVHTIGARAATVLAPQSQQQAVAAGDVWISRQATETVITQHGQQRVIVDVREQFVLRVLVENRPLPDGV